jgi:putative ABC transport system ATP-binding protein
LLNLIGTLDQPTSGVAEIAGMNVSKLSDSALSALRAYSIGFVFQQFHLSDRSTALDNVADGLLYAGVKRSVRRERARAALEQVGLALRVDHRSNQLSGGERQRVAIARAVVGEPVLLLADEPTGNLDSAAGDGILALLEELNRTGTTVVMITHDTELARRLPRRVTIRDGQIIDDSTFAKGAN